MALDKRLSGYVVDINKVYDPKFIIGGDNDAANWWVGENDYFGINLGANVLQLLKDEEKTAAYIDKYYDGDEAAFVQDVNKLTENKYIATEAFGIDIWSDTWDKYYEGYVERTQSEQVADIFGGDLAGVEAGDTYEEKRQKRSELLRQVLGDEISNLGEEDTDPTKLIDFAEYEPATELEKDLVQSGSDKYAPIRSRQEELKKLATGETKLSTLQESKKMISDVTSQGIKGLATAGVSKSSATDMQSSFSRLADRASAQNAMSERVTQLQDKQDATSKLSKMITENLEYDIKREAGLRSSRAKTAIGLAGAQLTAQEHAAQLAKANQNI